MVITHPHLLTMGVEVSSSLAATAGSVYWLRTRKRLWEFRQQVRRSMAQVRRGGSGLGDLTCTEVDQIQAVVDTVGCEVRVVGSAARGQRKPGSDIDYLIAAEQHQIWLEHWDALPGNEHPPVETLMNLDIWSQSAIVFRPHLPPEIHP